jgi:hypothetical protein
MTVLVYLSSITCILVGKDTIPHGDFQSRFLELRRFLGLTKRQNCVQTTESKGVAQSVLDLCRTGLIRNYI